MICTLQSTWLMMEWVVHTAYMVKMTDKDSISDILVTKSQTKRSLQKF
jgi:hypothetical protein